MTARGRLTRLVAAALLLFVQVFVVFSSGNLVICTDDDGGCATEWIGSACCKAARAAEHRAEPSGERGAGPKLRAFADHCHDEPLRQDQTVVTRSSQEREAAAHAARAQAPAIVVAAAAIPRAGGLSLLASPRAPPRGPVPRRPALFSLRC